MPVYEYEHDGKACEQGKVFEVTQPISDDRLLACPHCGKPVTRLISGAFISTPTTTSAYKNMGFTKLVKREEGVYENVTRGHGETKYMERGKADTVPDLTGKIRD